MTLITSIVCPSFQVKQDTDKLRVMYREGPDDTPFHTLLAEGQVDGPADVCELNIALFIAFELAVSQALLRFNFLLQVFVSHGSQPFTENGEFHGFSSTKSLWVLSYSASFLYDFCFPHRKPYNFRRDPFLLAIRQRLV